VPTARFAHSVTVPLDAATVWDALQQPGTWEGIGPMDRVFDARYGADGTLTAYGWNASIAGRHWSGTARTTAAEPGERMDVVLDSSEIRVTISAALGANGAEGTRLSVDLTAESRSMLASLFWGVIEGGIRSGLPEQVEALAGRISGG
jgi:carbon monoxide dehydrogenase subunit G